MIKISILFILIQIWCINGGSFQSSVHDKGLNSDTEYERDAFGIINHSRNLAESEGSNSSSGSKKSSKKGSSKSKKSKKGSSKSKKGSSSKKSSKKGKKSGISDGTDKNENFITSYKSSEDVSSSKVSQSTSSLSSSSDGQGQDNADNKSSKEIDNDINIEEEYYDNIEFDDDKIEDNDLTPIVTSSSIDKEDVTNGISGTSTEEEVFLDDDNLNLDDDDNYDEENDDVKSNESIM